MTRTGPINQYTHCDCRDCLLKAYRVGRLVWYDNPDDGVRYLCRIVDHDYYDGTIYILHAIRPTPGDGVTNDFGQLADYDELLTPHGWQPPLPPDERNHDLL